MLPEFKKRIDTMRQILVGAVPSPQGQIDQITYALIYKFLNDIDDRSSSLPGGKRIYFVGEYEKYSWHNLMQPSLGAHDRLTLYRLALESMQKNSNLPELFQGIYQNAFLPFNDPRVLNLFLKEVDKFKHSSSDDIGDAYEYLLQITGSQGDVGQFRTPRHIIKFIVEAVNPTKDDSVLDPAVGTAGFLIAAFNHVKRHHDGVDEATDTINEQERQLTSDELNKLHHSYHGFDIDPTMVRTAKVNMYLHGFTSPDIKNHDSLSSEDFWNERYDVILANPPFMSPKGGIKPHDKFGIKATRAEVLFVDYIASHVKPTGRAGIVVPEGIIFQSGQAYKELRKNLVENYLYAVISLPAGVFQPYSGVKTSVLLLDRELAKRCNEILFIKIENDGLSLSTQRREISGNQFPEALEVIKQFQLGEKIDSSLAHTAPRKTIAETDDYNLNGDRYRATSLAVLSEYPHVELGEVASFINGYSFKKEDWRQQGKPIIRIQNLTGSSSEFNYTDQDNWPTKYKVEHGDLLISWSASIGFYLWQGNEAYLNQHIFKVVINENKILKKYLYFLQDKVTSEIKKHVHGNTMTHVTRKDFQKIKIPLPPIEIQRQIVAELDSYQKIINAAQTIVNTYKPIIKISPEWRRVKIGDIFKTSSGGTPSKSVSEFYNNGTIPWLGSGEVAQGEIYKSKNFITEEALRISSAKLFPINSVLIAMYGATVGQVGILKFESSTNQAVCAILPNTEVAIPEFVYNLMKTYKEDLIRLSTGGAQPNISQQIIRNFIISLPSLKEQKQIVAELEKEQSIINNNEQLIEIFTHKIKNKVAEIWGE